MNRNRSHHFPTPALGYHPADNVMGCPLCGGGHTHVDDVYFETRPGYEDGDVRTVRLQRSGLIDEVEGRAPVGIEGRRHNIVLVGWCEECHGTFGISFLQHKGSTLMTTAQVDGALSVMATEAKGWCDDGCCG